MSANHRSRIWSLIAVAGATLLLGACSSVTERTRSALYAVTPYRVEVVQGNFVSREQVDALKPGQSKQQVRELLGTSLLTDVFHSDRWDYVFTISRQGVEPQQRRLTLFFKGELLERYEGDTMPSEQDFVATLDTRKRLGKVPQLEASEEQLKKFTPGKTTAPMNPTANTPLPASYPPLESKR